MTADDFMRFAKDLRERAGLKVILELALDRQGLQTLQINGVDFFFNADGSGYDGWGADVGRSDHRL